MEFASGMVVDVAVVSAVVVVGVMCWSSNVSSVSEPGDVFFGLEDASAPFSLASVVLMVFGDRWLYYLWNCNGSLDIFIVNDIRSYTCFVVRFYVGFVSNF